MHTDLHYFGSGSYFSVCRMKTDVSGQVPARCRQDECPGKVVFKCMMQSKSFDHAVSKMYLFI